MRAVGIILMIIGALLGGTGGYGLAQYVRPGDWVLGPKVVANPNGEHVIVTQYGALTYDSQIRLTATSASEVFVGTANPIDVDDYTAGVAHSTISSLSFQRIGITSASTDVKDPPAEPSGLDLWLSKASGTSPTLAVAPGSAVPAQAVLVAKTGSPVTVRVDYQVAGVRVAVFAVIVAGAALAFIGLVLLLIGILRARRRKNPKATPPAAPIAPPVVPPYGPYGQYGQSVPPPWSQGPVSRWVTGLVAVTLIVSSSGCTMPTVPKAPKAVDVASRAEVTKVPLPSDRTTSAAVSIEHRATQAGLDGYTPKYSTDGWAALYTDLSLQRDVYESTYAKAASSTDPAPSCSATIDTVYHSVAKAYPMAATALVRWDCTGSGADKVITVLTRAHSYSPWLISAESFLVTTAPEPGTVAPTAAEEQAGSAAVTDVLTYLNKGTVGTVKPTMELATFYSLVTTASEGAVHTVSATLLSNADKQGTFRTAETATGTLVTASYVATAMATAKSGYELWWPAPLDQVLGQTGHRPVLQRKYGVVVTVLIEGGNATMVGVDANPIL